MSWAARRAQVLAPKSARPAFSPGLPYFVQIGPTTWIETPYARAHCVFCPNELAEGDKICCPSCRERLDRCDDQ